MKPRLPLLAERPSHELFSEKIVFIINQYKNVKKIEMT